MCIHHCRSFMAVKCLINWWRLLEFPTLWPQSSITYELINDRLMFISRGHKLIATYDICPKRILKTNLVKSYTQCYNVSYYMNIIALGWQHIYKPVAHMAWNMQYALYSIMIPFIYCMMSTMLWTYPIRVISMCFSYKANDTNNNICFVLSLRFQKVLWYVWLPLIHVI